MAEPPKKKPTPPPVPSPAPAAAASAPLAHLLRDPQFLGIFIETVDEAAANPRDPGHESAKWLKPQLDDLEGNGREDVIRMFEKMKVMTTLADREEPSKYDGKKEVKQFLTMLTPGQKKSLTDHVITDDRSRLNPRRMMRPEHLPGMSRRAFLGTAAAVPLAAAAAVLHSEANDKTKQATTPPKQPDAKGREDEFFGPDPRDVAEQPQNQRLMAEARDLDKRALGYGVAAAAAGTYGLANLARRLYTPHSGRFKKEVRETLVEMDSLVKDAKLEAYRQKDGAAPPGP